MDMKNFQSRAGLIKCFLLFVLLVVHVLPVWRYPYFPSQDGPAHIYNSVVMLSLADADNYRISEFFTSSLKMAPNLLAGMVLLGLMTFLPALIAEKVLLTMIIVALPLSMIYAARSFDRKNDIFALMGFLFSYNHLLLMGFYNFCLGVPLCMVSFGFWVRLRHDTGFWRQAAMCGLLLLTYLAHFAAFAGLLIALVCITLFDGFYDWRRGRSGQGRRFLITRLQILVPALIAGAAYFFTTRVPGNEIYARFDWLGTIFFSHATLVTYTIRHRVIALFMWLVVGLAIFINVKHRLTGGKGLSHRDGLLVISLVFFVLFWTMPWWQNNGGWINDRIFLLLILFFVLWFERFRGLVRTIFVVVIMVLSLAQLGLYMQEFSFLQSELATFVSGAPLVRPHSTVKALVANDSMSDSLGPTINISPFKHAYGYYGLRQDVVCLDNYQAKYDYFPVDWKNAFADLPDYIIAWRQGDQQHLLKASGGCYELIYSNKHLKLFEKNIE